MISPVFFVALLVVCFAFIILLLFANKNDVLFICLLGILAAILLTVMCTCAAVIDGRLQVWETDKLHAFMSTKCFHVGHEQKCGVFDITTDGYRYVSDGNKLTVYAK